MNLPTFRSFDIRWSQLSKTVDKIQFVYTYHDFVDVETRIPTAQSQYKRKSDVNRENSLNKKKKSAVNRENNGRLATQTKPTPREENAIHTEGRQTAADG